MTEQLTSKILVLENDLKQLAFIKQFADEHSLVPLKVRKNRLFTVLKSSLDLGAIILSYSYGGSESDTVELATRIHAFRPELPIILRVEDEFDLSSLPETLKRICCATFSAADSQGLQQAIQEYIFSLVYPNALVRGISEITETALASQFKNLTVSWETPFIVRDRLIFGEVYSLIPLESSWCRGYMTLQTEEMPVLHWLGESEKIHTEVNFRNVNSLLGEVTNLIWGAFKNRFIGDESVIPGVNVEVPLVVNHKHKYISFGTENPQLCFLYTLTNEERTWSMKIYQRFVFNLRWAPEKFREIEQEVDGLVDAGELELF